MLHPKAMLLSAQGVPRERVLYAPKDAACGDDVEAPLLTTPTAASSGALSMLPVCSPVFSREGCIVQVSYEWALSGLKEDYNMGLLKGWYRVKRKEAGLQPGTGFSIW